MVSLFSVQAVCNAVSREFFIFAEVIMMRYKLSSRKIRSLILTLFIITMCLGLFNGCSGSKKLTVSVDLTAEEFSFIDLSSNEVLLYDKLTVNGKEICETHILSSGSFVFVAAFEEPPVKNADGSIVTRFEAGKGLFVDNGTLINNGSEWSYSLNGGILSIKR